ncbi:hydrogenase maturation protease [Stieleria sp. ICT_E10.1]|uniref:hydrogenase maturation protease n=1 Tax=Stieleria sedimenti TaxID=2976331 RepID=UPI0021808BF6|nr:hydrogenase maturation protease [Stieleria sedimenti]MCS7468650.1 hydrogenase maturation protease [Stieleria sedimenti]
MKLAALVIGLGNTLRGDDALGPIAAERVRQAVDPQSVRVINRCEPTPDLALELIEAGCAIFLDASIEGPADRVLVRRLHETNAAEALGHQLSLGTLLSLTRRLYGYVPKAFAITFRGRTFELSDHCLTPEAESAVAEMVAETLRLIESQKVTADA